MQILLVHVLTYSWLKSTNVNYLTFMSKYNIDICCSWHLGFRAKTPRKTKTLRVSSILFIFHGCYSHTERSAMSTCSLQNGI